MKKNFLISALLLMAVGMSLTVVSCSSDDDENRIEDMVLIGNVQTETGTVFYNDNVGRWYIYCVKNGTFDDANMYFPLQLKADFKVIGTRVTFSGKIYEPDFPIAHPAGTNYYLIDLDSIVKQ